MAVTVSSFGTYVGSVASSIGTEVTVFEYIGDGTYPFMVEGYISLAPMETGDTVYLTEYHQICGTTYGVYAKVGFADAQSEPIIHLAMKTFKATDAYKVTILQTEGTAHYYPYSFILEKIGT